MSTDNNNNNNNKMKRKNLAAMNVCVLMVAMSSVSLMTAQQSDALPAFVARATDSISALLGSASGRSLPAQQVAAGGQPPVAQAGAGEGQWVPTGSNAANATSSSNSIQAQFSSIQAQAQRQLNQLVAGAGGPGFAAANLTMAANRYGSNMLEVLSNVGKAIQQQIAGNGQIQIINSAPSAIGGAGGANELANTKKNEYQSIPADQPAVSAQKQQQQPLAGGTNLTINYREQSEQLRQEIQRRVGQLQQVVASSMDLLKNNGDLIVRRLLEQLNHRLDQAKSKADKIISEPATNEMAIKALSTINQGLNNLNNIITNIVSKLELSAKEAGQQQQAGGLTQRGAGPLPGPPALDPARFKMNLQQLGQQFSSAINAVQQQRQLQQQQQQQAAGLNGQPLASTAIPASKPN